MPPSEQDSHHTPSPTVWRHCWTLHQNGPRAPEGLSRKVTHLIGHPFTTLRTWPLLA
jgi:hypothetical protein